MLPGEWQVWKHFFWLFWPVRKCPIGPSKVSDKYIQFFLRNRGTNRQLGWLVQLKLSTIWFWWEKKQSSIKKLRNNWKFLKNFADIIFGGRQKTPEISWASIFAVNCIKFTKITKFRTPPKYLSLNYMPVYALAPLMLQHWDMS